MHGTRLNEEFTLTLAAGYEMLVPSIEFFEVLLRFDLPRLTRKSLPNTRPHVNQETVKIQPARGIRAEFWRLQGYCTSAEDRS